MRPAATALLLTTLACPVVAAQAAASLGLPAQPISFVAEADGGSSLITLRVTVAKPTDPWVIDSNVPWLEVAPRSGRGSQQLVVGVAPAGLEPGRHRARLMLRAANQPGANTSLAVSYDLQPARGVSVSAGDRQLLVINQPAGQPFEAVVMDADGNPLAGVPVTFETVVGVTEPAQAVVMSDADGRARFRPVARQYGAVEISASADIADDAPARFSAVTSGWVSTLAGDGLQAYGGDDGPAAKAHLNAPFGMVLLDGDLLVVDYFNHALRRIDLESGSIHALAGNGKQGFGGDGGAALDAVLSGPFGVALDPGGDIVLGDYYNNRIRVIDRDSGIIETVAGNGRAGYSGDGGDGLGASIDVPLDVVADSRGRIYLSDWHHHVVRRFDPASGRIETIAGIGRRAFTGKGPARVSGLSTPLGMSMDRDDNLYIADYGNNMVRRIDAQSGEISTVAGSGERGYSGDGGQAVFARLNRPYNVYADDDGGLFISDAGNHRVRHVDLASGIITTVAGSGSFGYSPAPQLAPQADFKGPFSVIKDADGTLYVAEYFGHRVRRITSARPPEPAPEPELDRLLRQARSVFGVLPAEASAAENPLTAEKIELGRILFHDRRLSRDGSVSCSSCHELNNYGIDGLALARGIDDQVGTRNSPSVFNAALQDSLFWDGRAANVEEQAREPLLNPIEMAMPGEAAVVAAVVGNSRYRELFARAFPGESAPISFANITAAIGAFERRLVTPGAAIDRFIEGDRGALSAQQLRGLNVFFREGCASCHAGPLLGGQDMRLIEKYPDTPAGDRFEFRKRLGNTHKFKVAPLRNIARTGPYLHDGRYRTLRDSLGERLIAYMIREAGTRDTVDLAEGEMDDLLAFLEALTGQVDRDYIANAE